jgi:formylglycine-generating enzyme required for sulfatase activity
MGLFRAVLPLAFALAAGVPAAGAQEKGAVETVSVPGTDFKFEMVYIPGGKFRMGSPDDEKGRDKDEGPAREVEVRPFWIGKYEMSWELFARYFESHKDAAADGVTRPSKPYESPNAGMGTTGRHPAVSVRWHGAIQCIEWISRKTGQRFRLPTEAEWEYACRAGSDAAAPEPLADHAWFKENSQDKTHEGGQKKANAFGLHDMLGNVWEFCLEPYKPPQYVPVLRGGSWSSPAKDLRAASRQVAEEDWYERDPNRPRSLWWYTDATFVGFRLVRSVDPAGKAEQEAYAEKIEAGNFTVKPAPDAMSLVSGEIRNKGDKTLEEVELTVYYLDEKGAPLFADRKDRPTFNRAYPVLANSAHPGEAREPLAPGGVRRFEITVPQAYDYDADLEKVGAKVTGIRFAAK